MSREDGTVRVKAIPHEAMRFIVESWSKPDEPYIVDLAANNGSGSCTCVDFQTRCYPNWKEIGKPVDYWMLPRKGVVAKLNKKRTRCRHIEAAIKLWKETTLKEVSKLCSASKKDRRTTECSY